MSEWWSIDYDEGYDEGYRAGMQKMREVGQRRIEELEANINIKADFIEATINQLAESDQRIAELEETLALRTNLHGEATYLIHKLEAKLSKAMLALEEAIYLLDPDDEDIAKETGLHRIVTTYKELKGEK